MPVGGSTATSTAHPLQTANENRNVKKHGDGFSWGSPSKHSSWDHKSLPDENVGSRRIWRNQNPRCESMAVPWALRWSRVDVVFPVYGGRHSPLSLQSIIIIIVVVIIIIVGINCTQEELRNVHHLQFNESKPMSRSVGNGSKRVLECCPWPSHERPESGCRKEIQQRTTVGNQVKISQILQGTQFT